PRQVWPAERPPGDVGRRAPPPVRRAPHAPPPPARHAAADQCETHAAAAKVSPPRRRYSARQSYVARLIGGILSARIWSVAFSAGRPRRSRPRRPANAVQSAHHGRHRNARLLACPPPGLPYSPP